jgi:hypothetical protein
VAELGAVVGKELQGSIAVGAVLRDLSLNLAGVGTTDSLGVGRVVGATEGVDQLWNSPNIPQIIPFLLTYPMTLRTQAGVWTLVVVPAATTLARAMTATAKMDLLNNMVEVEIEVEKIVKIAQRVRRFKESVG